MFQGIDLYSDTVTRPSEAMKKAMCDAPLGDEQVGDDPTTQKLERVVAEMLGFSSALFFPSATMANQVALQILCERGNELIGAENCHQFLAEAGGPAVHAGAMARPIASVSGIFTGQDIRKFGKFVEAPLSPRSQVVNIENTSNFGGGIPWPLDVLEDVVATSKELGLKLHLDGCRLFNASVKQNRSAKDLCRGFDTVTICLSKGLGCPIGAVLAFPQEAFPLARKLKQRMGGALRQSGMLAAAGLYALENHIEGLAVDHENAQAFARELEIFSDFFQVENPHPETNMVFMTWAHGQIKISDWQKRCMQSGVRFSQIGPDRLRAVFHRDVKREDIPRAISILKQVCNL